MRGTALGSGLARASLIVAVLVLGHSAVGCAGSDTAKKADDSAESDTAKKADDSAESGTAKKADDSAANGIAKPVPTEQVKSKPGSRFGVVEAGPFQETTVVRGKVDADLTGVWLLVANLEVVPGKFRNFPQLFKITNGDNGPEFHLLDVKLPEDIDKSVKAAKAERWPPTAEMRKSLAAQWSKLPLAKEKTINDFLYERVQYELTAPDHYGELVPKDEKLDKTLADSKFGVRITESYRPRELPKDVAVSQVAQRVSIYGVKKADKETLHGEQLTGFVAVGIAMPLPFTFSGPFVMYRLAPL
jgi:hypothetical protein